MGYRVLSQMFLMWLFSSTAAGRETKNSYSCTSSCSQVQRAKTLYGATCSCSKSCLIYNDCCRDAPYQNTGSVNIDQKCIMLNSLGPVSLVSNCPPPSRVWSEACHSELETFVPVTGKDTGTSYLNYFCALCNNDANVVTWPVQLRCYGKRRQTKEGTAVEISVGHKSTDNRLRSLLKYSNEPKLIGDCQLYAENDDLTFTKSLELRQCFRGDISECWPSWKNQTTRKLCDYYLDPVYNGNGVYRNENCAQCNGQLNWTPKCFLLGTGKNAPKVKKIKHFDPTRCPYGTKPHPKTKKCVSVTA